MIPLQRTFNKINFKDFELSYKKIKYKWMTFAKKFWWGDRLDVRFLATYILKDIHNKRILDIGCNSGIVLSEIGNDNFKVGIDISIDALSKSNKISDNNSNFIRADMLRLPFKRETFDFVILFGVLEVLEHEDKVKFISSISNVIKDKGEVFITTLNREYLTLLKKTNKLSHRQLIKLLETQYKVEAYGFNPFPDFPFFLPNRMLVSMPFIWNVLIFLMNFELLMNFCRSFIVKAEKK